MTSTQGEAPTEAIAGKTKVYVGGREFTFARMVANDRVGLVEGNMTVSRATVSLPPGVTLPGAPVAASAAVDAGPRAEALPAEALAMRAQAEKKFELLRAIETTLGVDLAKGDFSTWSIWFAAGNGSGRRARNFELAYNNDITKAAKLSPGELDAAARTAPTQRHNEHTSNLIVGRGYVSLSVVGREYHHSFILGNHNTNYGSFQLSMSSNCRVEAMTQTAGRVTARVTSYSADGTPAYSSTLDIQRSGGACQIAVRNWREDSFLSKLFSRTARMKMDAIRWSRCPTKEAQSFGL